MEVSPIWKGDSEVLSKPKPGERTGPKEDPFDDESWTSTYPNIAAHLGDQRYADQTPRTTSTLLIFMESGVLRICLNDRDNNRSVFITGATIESALLKLEDQLATQTVEWKTRWQQSQTRDKTPF